MKKIFCTVILLFVIGFALYSNIKTDSVRFYGKAPEYAGYNLVFYKYSNFIIPETTPVVNLTIGKDGGFNFSFPLNETLYSYTDLGRFRAFIYLEPGLSYHLVLPPFEPKSDGQILNPHFQPEEIPLGIANEESSALTRNIVEFNEAFNNLYNTNAVTLFTSGNINLAKKIEKELDEKFTFSHPYFKSHKHFSFLKLWQMTLRRQDRQLIYKYFSSGQVDYNLPVYWDAFRTLVSGFLPGKLSAPGNKLLSESLASNVSFDSLTNILATDTIFKNRQFAETSLLFMLYESFYNKSFGEQNIISITRSAITKANSHETKEMASIFHLKISQLRPGTVAPEFSLFDRKGKIKTLADYSGKFVYLNFIYTKNYHCLKDLRSIEQFEKIFRKELEIVSVVLDENYDSMEEFLKKHNRFNWEFLHFGASPKIIYDYNIKAAPYYYLINPEGKITLSPAPSPDENFRQLFIEHYREYKRNELRKTPPRERSIFIW